MDSNELETTVPIKPCSACRAGLLDRDKFCRWCGVRQSVSESTGSVRELATRIPELKDYRTTRLVTGNVYHPVSGPLVNAVVEEVATRTTGGFSRRLAFALISVPIWLIIVLLSPLDAYASAKILADRI